MTIDEEVATAGAECDARFDRNQPQLIAELRAQGVSDAEMPEMLSDAYDEFERQRNAALEKMRTLLMRLEQAQARIARLEAERTPIAPPKKRAPDD